MLALKCPVCGGDEFATITVKYDYTASTGERCETYRLVCVQCDQRKAPQQPAPPDERSPEALGSAGDEPRDVVSEEG